MYINVVGGWCGGMSLSGGISKTVLLTLARSELNTCPVCWMPLCIGEGNEANMWCMVQVLFKNKPSEVTEHKTTFERNRALNVFGMPFAAENCDSSHFIHRSSQGINAVHWGEIWIKVLGASAGAGLILPIERDALEPEKDSTFYSCVCIQKGLFRGDDDALDPFDPIVGCLKVSGDFNFVQSEGALNRLRGVFAGCKDCNSKMTINNYTRDLFGLVFPSNSFRQRQSTDASAVGGDAETEPGAKKRKREQYAANFGMDDCIRYLMLSGLLRDDELCQTNGAYNGKFNVSAPERRKSWQFRVVLIWCQLQILFCIWKLSSLDDLFEHHVGYIYYGTSDLYMSFILYIMHCVSADVHSREESIGFETFHYFYSSLYPQFIRKNAAGVGRVSNNLSDLILEFSQGRRTEWNCPLTSKINRPDRLAIVRLQLAKMRKKIMDFWQSDFSHLSGTINSSVAKHADNAPAEQAMAGAVNYFTSYTDSNRLIAAFKRETTTHGLTLQTSVNVLTPHIYWLHFNYITLPSIRTACDRCDGHFERLPPVERSAYQTVWRWWYNRFMIRTRALGVAQPSDGGVEGGGDDVFPAVLPSADLASGGGGGSWLRPLLALVERLGMIVDG